MRKHSLYSAFNCRQNEHQKNYFDPAQYTSLSFYLPPQTRYSANETPHPTAHFSALQAVHIKLGVFFYEVPAVKNMRIYYRDSLSGQLHGSFISLQDELGARVYQRNNLRLSPRDFQINQRRAMEHAVCPQATRLYSGH